MKSVKHNFVLNSLYQILQIIVPIITTPYLSRTLGAESIGLYAYNYSIAYYFSIFILLGLNNYGNRAIATVRDDKNKLSHAFWSIYGMQLLLGIIILTLYFLYGIYLSKNTTITLLFFPFLISTVIDINWLFFGLEEFGVTILRSSFVKIFSTILIFALIKTPSDIEKYCALMSISMLVSQIVVWPFLLKRVNKYTPRLIEILVLSPEYN